MEQIILFFALGVCLVAFARGTEVDVCKGPKTVPKKRPDQPGYYALHIVLNSCNNQVYIDNKKLTYKTVALDLAFAKNQAIDSLNIYVGDYAPCQKKFDSKIVNDTLKIMAKYVGKANLKTLRMYNVPDRNFAIVNAARKSVTLLLLANCNEASLKKALTGAEHCYNLRTLVLQGSVEFKFVWNALFAKPELRQIHIEQDYGRMSEHGLARLFASLPNLDSAILKCRKKCISNFYVLMRISRESLANMSLISLENRGAIDRVGIRLSEFAGQKLGYVLLKGEKPVSCDNFVGIITNLMQINDTEGTNPNGNIYLTAESDCESLKDLWNKVGKKIEDMAECAHPLEECRKNPETNTAVLIQEFSRDFAA